MDGTTRWNASPGEPPKASGAVSGPMMFMNSATEPGQPCVMISGRASGEAERTCRKCTRCPSITVVNCGNELSSASCTRQS